MAAAQTASPPRRCCRSTRPASSKTALTSPQPSGSSWLSECSWSPASNGCCKGDRHDPDGRRARGYRHGCRRIRRCPDDQNTPPAFVVAPDRAALRSAGIPLPLLLHDRRIVAEDREHLPERRCATARQHHLAQLRPDQRCTEPRQGTHQLRHLHRWRPAGNPRVRHTGRIRPGTTALSRSRPAVRLHAAAADGPIPAADHPVVRDHREKLRTRQLLPRDDRAVRDQLHRRFHLPAILPAGAERAVRRRPDRRGKRAARPDPHRTPAHPPRGADRDAPDLYRAVERVPVALPDHQGAEPAATRGRPGQLHHHRVVGRDESVRCDHGRSIRAGPARGRIVHHIPAALRVRQYRLRRERLTVPPTVTTNVPYRLTRMGVLMSAEPGAEFEAEGVLNPASGRSPDGRLWLLIHHGVSGTLADGWGPQRHLRYSAGDMLLNPDDPGTVLARTPSPLLEPLTAEERDGAAPNVVFPTAIEEIAGQRFAFYGIADSSIGVASLDRIEAL